MNDTYNLEIYEDGQWQIVCEGRTKPVVGYWATQLLKQIPDAELVIIPVRV